MAPEEICDVLKKQFGDSIQDTALGGGHPYALVTAGRWPDVAQFLKGDTRLSFNMLRCVTALDLLADNKLAAVYDLLSIPAGGPGEVLPWMHEFAVRVEVDRDDPRIPSVANVWQAADWHEREAFDLMGIVFEGHPDPRRILCPDDWPGHPLRKDYAFPVEYHGIPGTTEHELLSPRH
ncbi:MAG: NADH-quinone oxidoreductase subunit C [Phycisphaerae bacterium]